MREDELCKAITQKLEKLTYEGTVQWKKEGQVYKTSYKNLVFEIEDSGKNWLEIKQENGHGLSVIMDSQDERNVELLLETIKRSYAIVRGDKLRVVDTRTTVLGTILDVLYEA